MKRRPTTGGGVRDYGYTTSPLVYHEWVIVEVGADDGNLTAFDQRTGKRRWCSSSKDPAGHAGGITPITVQGIPCVAVLTLRRLVVVWLDQGRAGETLAQYPWQTEYANNIVTPAVAGNTVLLSSGYNLKKMVLLEITSGGARKLWESGHHSNVCSPVIYRRHIYTAYRKLRCLELATGKLRWEGGDFAYNGSCLATADGRLIVFGKGRLALVETAENSPSKYAQLAHQDHLLPRGESWPHVVLAHWRVDCKDRQGNLRCLEVGLE